MKRAVSFNAAPQRKKAGSKEPAFSFPAVPLFPSGGQDEMPPSRQSAHQKNA
jgi:hypothetical protein